MYECIYIYVCTCIEHVLMAQANSKERIRTCGTYMPASEGSSHLRTHPIISCIHTSSHAYIHLREILQVESKQLAPCNCVYVHMFVHVHVCMYTYIHTHTYKCNCLPSARIHWSEVLDIKGTKRAVIMYVCIYIYTHIYVYMYNRSPLAR